MTRNQWSATALALMLFVTSAATAQESRFFSSQETGGAPGRYRVELEIRPGDDLIAISGQLAATYGARIEPYAEEGFHGFAIIATAARARLMSSDPRVVAITDLSGAVKPVPPHEEVVAAKADTPTAAVEQTRRALTTEEAPGFGDYTYDPSGNITSIGDHDFRYDAFGRVQSADLGAALGTQVYTYDRYGNILKIVTNGDEAHPAIMGVDPETNQMDLPFSESNPANMIATYDTVGNVIVFQGSYEYDALNMMKETTDSARRLHIYSASDERVVVIQVQGNDETTSEWTLRDGSNRVLRRLMRAADGKWSWKEDYVYGGSRLLAAEVSRSGSVTEQVRHFHLDHLGTPRLITGNGGVRIAEKTYRPFGEKIGPVTDDLEQLEFTGHERDLPYLDYMHARYYRPDLGRFLSVDPVWASASLQYPQSWNRYSYVGNNPVAAVDPTGTVLRSTTGQGTLCAIAGEACERLSYEGDGTLDTSQFTEDDLLYNEGALALHEMATNTDTVWTYEEGTTAPTLGATVVVSGVLNLDDNPLDVVNGFGNAVPKGRNRYPVPDVNGAVTVNPNVTWTDDATGSLSVPLAAVAFHELLESYSRVLKNIVRGPDDGGPGGHYDAQVRERYMIWQRPTWTQYPAGGVLRKR